MFNNNAVLKPSDHAELGLLPTRDWSFAQDQQLLPLVVSEIADAALEYPLVFIPGKPLVYALVALERGHNAYLRADGHWHARYIPARLRAYPFGLTPIPGQQGRYALVIDRDAPQLQTERGDPLFTGDELSEPVRLRLRLLERMQQQEGTTQRVVTAIREAGLLVQRSLQVRKPDADTPALGGFEVVDEKRLNRLDPTEFAALRDAGALPLVYAHLLSLANLRQGPLAGKYPELANPAARPQESGTLFGAGDDTLQFDFDDPQTPH